MRKIFIFITIFFLCLSNSFAYMPISISDIVIGKISKINQFKNQVNGEGYEFNFKNYINYKIKKNSLEVLKYRKKLLNNNIVIFNQQLPIKSKLKKGDIVVVSRYSGGDGILKIGCHKNKMYIEGRKNKVFLSVFENGKNRIYTDEVDKYKHGIELGILKKFNKKVGGCSKIKTFFDKDRTLEDLDGKNLNNYFFIGIIGLLVFIILFYMFFKKFLGKN